MGLGDGSSFVTDYSAFVRGESTSANNGGKPRQHGTGVKAGSTLPANEDFDGDDGGEDGDDDEGRHGLVVGSKTFSYTETGADYATMSRSLSHLHSYARTHADSSRHLLSLRDNEARY